MQKSLPEAPVPEITLTGVEETMRLARLDLENEIARFRLILLGGVTLVSTVAVGLGWFLGGDAPLLLPLYFLGATIVAAALRRRLRTHGMSTTSTYASIIFDVVLLSASGPLGGILEERMDLGDVAFGPWLTTGVLAILVFLHSLRGDRRSLLFTAVLCAGVTVLLVGTTPAPGADESGQLLIAPAYRVMASDIFFPLVIMTLGVVGIASALAFYADAHARRRLRIHAKVLRYVPDAAYEHVKKEGTDTGIRAPGRMVEVTILASDLRGFTAMSERLEPQEVVNQLNAYHDAMCAEIERHGGMLDKLIGDGELAVFGWREPMPDAGAGKAVACARAMRAALEALNHARGAKSLPALAMGIGLHTGTCVAGNIGAGKKLSFTYIGDAVNAASRIEGLTKELGIPVLASEETVKRLPSRAGIREVGPTAVRGKTEQMVLHAVE